MRTSETLGIDLQRLCRYHRFLHDAAEVNLAVDGGRVILSHRLPAPGLLPRAVSEYIVATWLLTTRNSTAVNWIPLQVRFSHPIPESIAEHQRIFACGIDFGHDRNELVFSRELLDIPNIKADAPLQAILEAQVVAVLEKLPRGEATTDAVRRHIADELSDGEPRIERIAPRLHMSTRTLHSASKMKAQAFGKS